MAEQYYGHPIVVLFYLMDTCPSVLHTYTTDGWSEYYEVTCGPYFDHEGLNGWVIIKPFNGKREVRDLKNGDKILRRMK